MTTGLRRVPTAGLDPDMLDVADAVNDAAGVMVEVQAPATANREFAVRHALGKKAREVEIVSQDKAGTIFLSSRYRWSRTILYLKYDQSGGRLRLRVR